MDEDFTPVIKEDTYKCKKTDESPRKSTIDFLLQFAQAYSFQKELPLELGHFIAN